MVVQVNDVGMVANELRIGNALIVGGIDRIVYVSSIFKTHFRCEDKEGIRFEESIRCNYKPIPLTEKILENNLPEFTICSFRKECWVLREENSQFHIMKHKGRFIFRGLGMSIIYVDTLHHLQNLVFVNTGQELNVKL